MPVPSQDYYRILGVSEHADGEAIKKAYRALARALHPDCNPGDATATERFKLIQEAYAVLGTPGRRRQYDGQRLESVLGWLPRGSTLERTAPSGPAFDEDPSDPLAHLHAHVRVCLPFQQALCGGHKDVQAPGGEIVRVTVPKGCRNNLAVRVKGKGRAGTNGHTGLRGDLLVTFQVRPHPRFRREGNHLHLVERISAVEAMLGTIRTITNAYGRTIRIAIPAGTQPGKRFRLRGQGVATCAGAGDLFVEVDVEVPSEMTNDQRAQLRQTARTLGLL